MKEPSAAEYSAPASTEADATRSEVVHEWAGATSIHGINYVVDLNSRAWKRILFTILFCTCLGLLSWNLSSVIKTYLKYDTTTSIQTIAPQSLTFPDITVCNSNPFSAARVEATGITSPKNDEELNLVTQPLEEFILFSEFGNEDLNTTDFWTQTITDTGPCWTFHTDTKISRPGLTDGLVFAAFINRDDYYEGSAVEGVYIYVTEANTTTLTVERPFTDMSPGLAHTVFLDVTKFDREEDKPWSTCVKTPETFSQPACRAECFFDFQLEECGCRALGDNRPKSSSVDYCSSILADDDDDGDDTAGGCGADDDLDCACPDPPCKETVYQTRNSVLQLSQVFIDDVASVVNSTEDFVRNNLLLVQINFEAIRREEVTESKSVTLSGLLAAIGGLLGFFLGVSVFSFAEVFDLCFLRLLPRGWGDRRLFGLGSKVDQGEATVSNNGDASHNGRIRTGADEMESGGVDDGAPVSSGLGQQSTL